MRKQILTGALLGALLLPAMVIAQASAPATAKCPAAVTPVNDSLKQTAENLTKLIDQVEVIEGRVRTFYESSALPAGQIVPEFSQMTEEIQRTQQSAVAEVGQLTTLELRCTPNAPASVTRLNQEVAQAVNAVKTYRTAVRTELLTIRTKVEQSQAPSPSPSIVPVPERLQ